MDITAECSFRFRAGFASWGNRRCRASSCGSHYINAQGGVGVRDAERRSVRLIWYDDRGQVNCARGNGRGLRFAAGVTLAGDGYSWKNQMGRKWSTFKKNGLAERECQKSRQSVSRLWPAQERGPCSLPGPP